jgi:hypothetical protein
MRPCALPTSWPNLSVDSDAQLRMLPSVAPVGRRSPLRYTDAIRSDHPRGVADVPALRPSQAGTGVGVRAPRLIRAPGTSAAFLSAGERRPSLALCPNRAAPRFGAVASAADLRLPRAVRAIRSASGNFLASRVGLRPQWACGSSTTVSPALRRRPRYNRSVDTDALRQGAAQRRGESCAARPLAATRRSPSR